MFFHFSLQKCQTEYVRCHTRTRVVVQTLGETRMVQLCARAWSESIHELHTDQLALTKWLYWRVQQSTKVQYTCLRLYLVRPTLNAALADTSPHTALWRPTPQQPLMQKPLLRAGVAAEKAKAKAVAAWSNRVSDVFQRQIGTKAGLWRRAIAQHGVQNGCFADLE